MKQLHYAGRDVVSLVLGVVLLASIIVLAQFGL